MPLQWRHNDHDGVSNHQPRGCLLNHLFRRRSKKTSKFRVTGLCVGISPGPVNSPHKGPVTRKMFPFDDVIMVVRCVPRHEFRVTHCILQLFLIFRLSQNLTWCTLHPHILGVAAANMQYWCYVYKNSALISLTDVKCTVSHGARYWLSHHLYKCITELTQALDRDSM